MNKAIANDSQTPPLPQVSQIWTGEKVTKEWVLHDWPSSHEKLIDFATCGIPFGYTFDKTCEVNLYFDRHTISNAAVKTQYVALCGSVKNMRTPNYMAGMNLSVTSKSGKEYLKDHYVYFRNNTDFIGKSIKKDFILHTLNGALTIQEKNIHLFITVEPIYFRNKPTALETLEPNQNESETPIAPEVQQPPWVENVRKFLKDIEEKKKQPEIQKNEADLGVPEDIVKLLMESLQNALDADVELALSQKCTMDNMFQLYNVAKRCGLEKATEDITKYIKSNI